jgi:hypothetical protein
MGWLYLHECDTKASIRDHILRDCTSDDERSTRRVLAHRTVGNHLWLAYEAIPKAEKEPIRCVILFLLAQNEGNWGYKDMDETMHPYYYDCPKAIIEAAGPTTHEEAIKWRAKVDTYHAEQAVKRNLAKQITVGTVVTLKGCTPTTFRVASLAPFRGYCVESGRLYKLTKSRIVAVTPAG